MVDIALGPTGDSALPPAAEELRSGQEPAQTRHHPTVERLAWS